MNANATMKRVTLHAPPDFEAATAPIWAVMPYERGGETNILVRKYPDVAPVIGWQVQWGNNVYEVRAVSETESPAFDATLKTITVLACVLLTENPN